MASSAPDRQGAEERTCRICRGTEEDEDTGPWRRPCRCRGTMEWVHQGCLLEWVEPQLARTVAPRCELCRARMRLTFDRPHAGLKNFLCSRASPLIAVRSWLVVAFSVATLLLHADKSSFVLKTVLWCASAAAVVALYWNASLRGTSWGVDMAVEHLCCVLATLPALGFAAWLVSWVAGSRPLWDLLGSGTAVGWADTELMSLAGLYLLYFAAVGVWSLSAASTSLLLVLSRRRLADVWRDAQPNVRAWLTLALPAAVFVLVWEIPSCRTKASLLLGALLMAVVLIILHALVATDTASAATLAVVLLYLLSVISGAFLTFLFRYPPPHWTQKPSESFTPLSQISQQVSEREAVNLTATLSGSGWTLGGRLARGGQDEWERSFRVSDLNDYLCRAQSRTVVQGLAVMADEGVCDVQTKVRNAEYAGIAMLILCGRTPGDPAPDLSGSVGGGGPEAEVMPVVSMSYSEAWLMRRMTEPGYLVTLKSGYSARGQSQQESAMRIFAGHVSETLFADGVTDVPLFGTMEMPNATAVLPVEAKERDRLAQALSEVLGSSSDCVAQSGGSAASMVRCTGYRTPCYLANYCRYGPSDRCRYSDQIHYFGFSATMYGVAVGMASVMIIGFTILEIWNLCMSSQPALTTTTCPLRIFPSCRLPPHRPGLSAPLHPLRPLPPSLHLSSRRSGSQRSNCSSTMRIPMPRGPLLLLHQTPYGWTPR